MNYCLQKKPERIVCLTEETTEVLYLLGQAKRIVGISAYTVRPDKAKREKPIVSAFIGGNVKKICALKPDLIIGFSDIQAKLARDLVSANQQVLIFNQRSIQEILDVILIIGRLVGAERRAQALVKKYIRRIQTLQRRTLRKRKRTRVYFEEWDSPMICGIRWVSELIHLAGGQDVFEHKSYGKNAQGRMVSAEEVTRAAPEIIIGSWCGKPFDPSSVRARSGFDTVPAVLNDQLYEMDSSIILQPGPACLTDGLDRLEVLLSHR